MAQTSSLGNVKVELTETPFGHMLYLPTDEYVGKSLQGYGEYDPSERRVFERLIKKGMVVLDVGANVGVHSIVFGQLATRVFAFEPQPLMYKLLCANIGLNMLGPKICPINAGLGASTGSMSLPKMDYATQGNYSGVVLQKGFGVDIITIDMLRLKQVDFIKIDAEGMDREVLEGGRDTIDRCHPALWVENDKPDKAQALVDYIYELGYKAWWNITPLFVKDNFKNQKQNIYSNQGSFNLMCAHPDGWLKVEGEPTCTTEKNTLPKFNQYTEKCNA